MKDQTIEKWAKGTVDGLLAKLGKPVAPAARPAPETDRFQRRDASSWLKQIAERSRRR